MTSNHVPLISTFKMTFRMTFRMTLRMTSKTWDFRGVFNSRRTLKGTCCQTQVR